MCQFRVKQTFVELRTKVFLSEEDQRPIVWGKNERGRDSWKELTNWNKFFLVSRRTVEFRGEKKKRKSHRL